MHPLLLPGTHLLRRGDGRLQAGLARDASSLLPGAPRPLTQLLADEAAMATLLRRGLATPDDRPVREALPAARDADPWTRHALAAASHGPAWSRPAHPQVLGPDRQRRCHPEGDTVVKALV